MIVTGMTEKCGFTRQQIEAREREIAEVARRYQFASVTTLGFPATLLDTLPMGEIVAEMKGCIDRIKAEVLYIPNRGDVHTDHRVVFDAAVSCAKWFRSQSVRRVLTYETLSETEFGLDPGIRGFHPNVFVDIGAHLEEKLEILGLFAGETAPFPFPRSIEVVRAQAVLRGSVAGCSAAESFVLLKEIL